MEEENRALNEEGETALMGKDPDSITLPSDKSKTLGSVRGDTNSDWDQFYKEYRNEKTANELPVLIYVEKIEDPHDPAKPLVSGYLKFNGKVGQGNGKFLFVKFKKDQINWDDFDVVRLEDKNDASMFSEENADLIIKLIQQNKKISQKEATFKKEKVSIKQANTLSTKAVIIKTFYKALSGDEGSENKLNNCIRELMAICDSRKNSPLVNNMIFKFLLQGEKYNGAVSYSDHDIGVVYNLVANGELSDSKIINADSSSNDSILNTLVYNKNFIDKSEKQIVEYIETYREILRLDSSIYQKLLGNYPEETWKPADVRDFAKRFSKNCLLNLNGLEPLSGVVKTLIDNTATDEVKEKLVQNISYKLGEDPNVLTAQIRPIDEMKKVLEMLSGEEKTSEEGSREGELKYYIQKIIASTGKLEVVKLNADADEGEIELSGRTFGFEKDDIIRLVKASDLKKEVPTLPNLLLGVDAKIILAEDDASKLLRFDSTGNNFIFNSAAASLNLKAIIDSVSGKIKSFKITVGGASPIPPGPAPAPAPTTTEKEPDAATQGTLLSALFSNRESAFKTKYASLSLEEQNWVKKNLRLAVTKGWIS